MITKQESTTKRSIDQINIGTSSSTLNNQSLSGLNAYTSDELTAGLNRMEHQQYQKLARQSARKFLKPELDMSTPLTPQHQHGESVRFMNFLVQTVVDKHKDDPTISKLARDYNKVDGNQAEKAMAFAKFEKAADLHIQEIAPFNAGLQLGYAVSSTCNQIASLTKNKELARVATGIGAMTQAVDGINKISQAVEMMSQAATVAAETGTVVSGTAAMASGAAMIGPAGMVIAAAIMIYALCSAEEEENGLGDALSAIHSTVMDMWADTRKHFAKVFEALDMLDEKITDMERQNWKRFWATANLIDYYGKMTKTQIKELHTTLHGSLDYSAQVMESYLQGLTDEAAITTAEIIRLEGAANTIKNIVDRAATLKVWLTNKATAMGHSGQININQDGTLDIEPCALTSRLKKTMGSESLPLGLFASIATHIDPTILPKKDVAHIIHTNDWSSTLACYLRIMKLSEAEINTFDSDRQHGFLLGARDIKEKPLLVLDLLSNMRDSDTLWDTLVNDYLGAYQGIQKQILAVLAKERDAFKKINNVDIELYMEQSLDTNLQNLQRLSSQSSPHDYFKKLDRYDGHCEHLLNHSPGMERLNQIIKNPIFYVADIFKLIDMSIDHHKTGQPPWGKLVLNADVLSLSYLEHHYKIYHFRQTRWFDGLLYANDPQGGFELFDDYDQVNLNDLKITLEEQILKPNRKQIAGKLQDINLTEFECARRKLLAFLKLLNPEFKECLNQPSQTILNLLRQLESTGDVESLQQLLSSSFSSDLLQSDLGCSIVPERTPEALKTLVKNQVRQPSLFQHRLWQTMAHAYASIQTLEHKLKQAPQLNSEQRKTAMHRGMLLLTEHHQRFSHAIQTMKSVAARAELLVKTKALSETVLPEWSEQMSHLDVQITPMFEAASKFNDDRDAEDYTAPEVVPIAVDAAVDLPEEKKGFLDKKWKEATNSMSYFDNTLTVITEVVQRFNALPVQDASAVLFVGKTRSGKSTLANASVNVTYTFAKNKLGRACVTAAESEIKEFAKTSDGSVSETLFPNMTLHPDGTFYVFDMPGFYDTRGVPQQVVTSLTFQCLPKHCNVLKGIVAVCDENELGDSSFLSLRTTLQNVGRMLPPFSDDKKNHVILAITKSSGRETVESTLAVLNYLATEEYASITEHSSDENKKAVKRALTYLIKSTDSKQADRILFVDVTKPESMATFNQTLKALPESEMSQFDLTPSSTEMELIKKVLVIILRANEQISCDIQQLQMALAAQLHGELAPLDMNVTPEVAQLKQELEAAISPNQEDCDLVQDFTLLVEQYNALVTHKAMPIKGTLSQQLLKVSDKSRYISGSTTLAAELIEKYNEREKYLERFNSITDVAHVLNAVQPVRQSVIKETLFDEGDGYETDEGAEDALEQDTRQHLSITQDAEKPIWIKPNSTPGLRTLSTSYISEGQRPAFLQFLADKKHAVKNSNTSQAEVLVQLAVSIK